MGCFTAVILLANVRFLSLAQSTQPRSHGSSSRDTAGTEERADVWTGGEQQVRGLKLHHWPTFTGSSLHYRDWAAAPWTSSGSSWTAGSREEDSSRLSIVCHCDNSWGPAGSGCPSCCLSPQPQTECSLLPSRHTHTHTCKLALNTVVLTFLKDVKQTYRHCIFPWRWQRGQTASQQNKPPLRLRSLYQHGLPETKNLNNESWTSRLHQMLIWLFTDLQSPFIILPGWSFSLNHFEF